MNESNAAELRLTKERLDAVSRWNDRLQDENHELQKKNEELMED